MADDNSTTFCECPAGYEAECVFPEWSCPRKGSNDTDRPLQPTRNSSTDRLPDGPAMLANRVWIAWVGGIVRLTFAEQDGPDATPQHRSSVALPASVAIDLYRLLREEKLDD